MPHGRYTDHPDLYDAVQSEWDYDRDVAFVLRAAERHAAPPERLLEVGCGTGEHARRFRDRGLSVVAVDPAGEMVRAARGKVGAAFVQGALPALPVGGRFDAVVALRGVVNHLAPDALRPAVRALAERVAADGVLVLDNSPLPPEGNEPALDVGTTAEGRYARVARMRPRDDGRLAWDAVTFTGEECVVTTRPMTPFEDATVAAAIRDADLAVETHDGFGPGDDRTVFVGVA